MNKSRLITSLLGICTFAAVTTLPLFGAGSEQIPTPTSGPQAKQANPAIKAYSEAVRKGSGQVRRGGETKAWFCRSAQQSCVHTSQRRIPKLPTIDGTLQQGYSTQPEIG